MATKKDDAPLTKASDFLVDAFNRSFEVMHDLTRATCETSKDASIASARYMVKFQKSSVKAGLGLVGKTQKVTEKSLRDALKKGKWLPRESREVVDEWSQMMKSGLDEFGRVTDKSFELLLRFLDRVEKEHHDKLEKEEKAASKPAARKTATTASAKAKTAKRKPAAKKKATTTATNKRTAKRKPAAKKKPSASGNN